MKESVAQIWGTRVGRVGRGWGGGGPQKPIEPIRHPKTNENRQERSG